VHPTDDFAVDIRQQLLKTNSRANADLVEQFIADRGPRYPNETKAVVRTIQKRLPTAKPGYKNRAFKILAQLE
jgi:hypothetical protein